jgi:hypothetical protein
VTFCSQSVKRIKQLRLWLPWVQEGYIYPFPTIVQGWNGLFKRLKISARTAVHRSRGGASVFSGCPHFVSCDFLGTRLLFILLLTGWPLFGESRVLNSYLVFHAMRPFHTSPLSPKFSDLSEASRAVINLPLLFQTHFLFG